jgi:preprotein translocase subunit YajC
MGDDKPTAINDLVAFLEGHTHAAFVRDLKPGDRITDIGWKCAASSWLVYKVTAVHTEYGLIETAQGTNITFVEGAVIRQLNDDVDAVEYMAQLAICAIRQLPDEVQLRVKSLLEHVVK